MLTTYDKAILWIEVHKKKILALRDYYNCILDVYNFLEENYSDYFAIGIRELIAWNLQDLSKYLQKNKRDIIY